MEGYTLGHTARDPQSREAKANKIIKIIGTTATCRPRGCWTSVPAPG